MIDLDKMLSLEKLPPNVLEAIYRPVSEPTYAGNPLIEALPPFYLAQDIMESFGVVPIFNEYERLKPDPDRMTAISLLNKYIIPLPVHYDLIDQIGLTVRAGYAYRNPSNPEYHKELVRLYRNAMDGEINPIGENGPSVGPALALIGDSGVGKSTIVERTLSFLPKALVHPKHHCVQLVYLKLDCSSNGELKPMLLELLTQIDDTLGSQFTASMKGLSIDLLMVEFARVAAMVKLGFLAVDEIHNILEARVGKTLLINYLVKFVNTIKVPLLIIANPRVLAELGKTFRAARRAGDDGLFLWRRMSQNKIWDFFLQGLFKFQWTKNPAELNGDLSKAFYEHTKGVHGLVVRLFQFCQLKAIRNHSERITIELVNAVAEEKFKLVKPILDAVTKKRKGKQKTPKQYDDLLDSYYKELKDDVENDGRIASIKAKEDTRNRSEFERRRTISALCTMGYEQEIIQQVVSGLFEEHPEMSCEAAVKKVLEFLISDRSGSDDSSNKSLSDIVKEGKREGASPMESLASAGVIGDPDSLVDLK